MKNNIIVTDGKLEGNISSCKYEFQEIITGRPNLFVTTHATIGVNNCTGKEIRADYWEVTGFSIVGILFFCVFLIALFIRCFES